MRYTYSESDAKYVSEMAIVDTFARLIFQDEGEFSLREKMIIETFKTVDANILRDSYSEIGEYLRDLGVKEMIHLVSLVRQQILTEVEAAMGGMSEAHAMGAAGGRSSH